MSIRRNDEHALTPSSGGDPKLNTMWFGVWLILTGLLGAYVAYVLYARVRIASCRAPCSSEGDLMYLWSIKCAAVGHMPRKKLLCHLLRIVKHTPLRTLLQEAQDRITAQGISLQARLRYQQTSQSPWTVVENMTCGEPLHFGRCLTSCDRCWQAAGASGAARLLA